jgi:hypothetical protein
VFVVNSLRDPVSSARTVQLPKSSDHAHDGRLDSVGFRRPRGSDSGCTGRSLLMQNSWMSGFPEFLGVWLPGRRILGCLDSGVWIPSLSILKMALVQIPVNSGVSVGRRGLAWSCELIACAFFGVRLCRAGESGRTGPWGAETVRRYSGRPSANGLAQQPTRTSTTRGATLYMFLHSRALSGRQAVRAPGTRWLGVFRSDSCPFSCSLSLSRGVSLCSLIVAVSP